MPIPKYMDNNICSNPLTKHKKIHKNISEKKDSQQLIVSLSNMMLCGTFVCITTGCEADLTRIKNKQEFQPLKGTPDGFCYFQLSSIPLHPSLLPE